MGVGQSVVVIRGLRVASGARGGGGRFARSSYIVHSKNKTHTHTKQNAATRAGRPWATMCYVGCRSALHSAPALSKFKFNQRPAPPRGCHLGCTSM
jgi:hypothetical protein